MSSKNRVLTALAASALALVLGGCTTRNVVRFEDHPVQNQTYVETIRHDNYLFSQSQTHEFWLCTDQDTKLVCKRSCDGKTDLACPADSASVTFGTSSNH